MALHLLNFPYKILRADEIARSRSFSSPAQSDTFLSTIEHFRAFVATCLSRTEVLLLEGHSALGLVGELIKSFRLKSDNSFQLRACFSETGNDELHVFAHLNSNEAPLYHSAIALSIKNPRTLRSSRRGDGNVYPDGVSPVEMPIQG